MTFAHAWVLVALSLPFAWVALTWRTSARRIALLLKAASFSTILIALAQPAITLPESKTGLVVLVDTSASITPKDLERASVLVSQIGRRKGRNWLAALPFASELGKPAGAKPGRPVQFLRASAEPASGTNLEAALTSAVAAIPAGYIPRLLLLSDGNENEGSAVRAVAELRQLDVPVDTIPLAGRPETALRLESIAMPRKAYTGELLPIDLTIYSPRAAQGSVELSAEGKNLGSNPVNLVPGINTLHVQARVKSTGATLLAGKVLASGLGELPFEQAIELRRARVLYLSEDPPQADQNLLQAFEQAGFDVTRDASPVEKGFDNVQLLVLNNLDLNTFTPAQKSRIEEYVKAGGGLLLISGEKQIYKPDQQMDALDRALPAKLAPPKTSEGTCVALIIDKSSSMEGRKIELARLSAIGVVEHLKPTDTIGVLIFDNSYQWAIPMRRAVDTSLMKRLISGITPDGGTQIAPALAEAYRKVLPSKASYKHIVLLTDGISEEGDSIDLAKEALAHQVTISTVGLGQDVNRSYLEKIAEASGGRSYFLNEPQGLQQILLKDVQDYSGSTAVEKPLTPIVVRDAGILDGVGMQSAPPLKGYSRFTAKPEAETILQIDPEKKSPLYVRWQYGLGRAGVFASDAKTRWAERWVNWPGFDKFWINASRDLMEHIEPGEASAQFDVANGDITVTYRLRPGVPDPVAPPPIFVLGPAEFEKPLELTKTAARTYNGRIHVGRVHGLFRIRPVNEIPAFPEIGVYRQDEELQDYGTNEALLARISALTGGRFNPAPASVFDPAGRAIYTNLQLWPGFLALAIALTMAELVIRKWGGFKARAA